VRGSYSGPSRYLLAILKRRDPTLALETIRPVIDEYSPYDMIAACQTMTVELRVTAAIIGFQIAL